MNAPLAGRGDDAFAARLFTMADVRQAVPHFDQMYEQIEGQFPGAPERVHHSVYFLEALVAERNMVAAMVGELFEHLIAHPEALAEVYRIDSASQPLHRAVCDYITGMTDGFFRRTYEQHFATGS